MPKITIGLPVYNAERFIGLTIRSIINQTFQDWELIITDDGSTDSTVEIIKSFQDFRIRLFVDGENHGISYRLNQQIDEARGEYFARMDADDIMLPDRLQRQYDYLVVNRDVDVVGGGAIIIDDDNNILGQRVKPKEVQLTNQKWLKGYGLIHPSVMGKLNFFRTYKYSEELKGIEDNDLWERTSGESKLIELPVPVIYYRDPLEFKLSTYLFRRRQNRKRWKSKRMVKKYGIGTAIIEILKCYMKSFLSILFSTLSYDKVLIARRNKPIEKNISTQMESSIDKLLKDNTI